METTKSSISSDPMLKFKVQRVIAIFSFLIFIGKLVAYFMTNSVGILTDALESTVNVVTGAITLYSIHIALKPRDEDHPFGHGKAEFLSASVEGFLIMIAGLVIIFEAVKRLFLPSLVEKLDIGIIIVAFAGLLNYIIGWYSIYIGKKNNSIALVSGGKHLQSDTYSSIGLVVGLVLLYYTQLQWLDSAIALIFGTIIIITGYKILKETTSSLMDEADFELIAKFSDIVEANRTEDWIDLHNFKLVKYGNAFHINCDLVLPWYINIADAHKEGEKLREIFKASFQEDIILNFHIDECTPKHCKNCSKAECSVRKENFDSIVKFDLINYTKQNAN